MAKPTIRILENVQQVAEASADEFIARARRAIEHHGRFTVALSGGSTPKALHGVLVERALKQPSVVDWPRVQIFFGDERHVPPDDPDSNFGMAKQTLLSKVPIPAENVHRMKCENPDAAQAAAEYDSELIAAFRLKGDDQLPRFDLILLGMGPDGHTASLFPGSEGIHETRKRVLANWVPSKDTWRVTFSFPVINHAECVIPMICGGDKAPALREVLDHGSDETYPIRKVRPTHGDLIWIVDRAAAAEISAKS